MNIEELLKEKIEYIKSTTTKEEFDQLYQAIYKLVNENPNLEGKYVVFQCLKSFCIGRAVHGKGRTTKELIEMATTIRNMDNFRKNYKNVD